MNASKLVYIQCKFSVELTEKQYVQYGPKKSEHRFYFESHLPTLRETMFHFWS
jgi:hypothetical protein